MKFSFFKNHDDFIKNNFLIFSCVLSAIIGILYLAKGFKEDFLLPTMTVIIANFLYVPLALIFQKKCFPYFYLAYSVILVFLIAFEKSCLYNNYTSLFIACIVMMIEPKLIGIAVTVFFISSCVAFSLNDEDAFHFLIYLARSVWFMGTIFFLLAKKSRHKTLILYEDEKKILEQLCNGKIYQKEVEGFSENTIYRKLKAARERNGNITRGQLVELFRKERDEKY